MQHFFSPVIVLLLIALELQVSPISLASAEYVSTQTIDQNRGNKYTLQEEYCTLGTDATHIDPPLLIQSAPFQVCNFGLVVEFF